MKKILIYCLVYLLISSCSKDLGNYKYEKINDLQVVSGMLTGNHPLRRTYRVSYGEEVNITPEYEGTVSGKDLSNIEFTWKVDGEVVSKDKNFKYVADKKFGKILCEMKMLDKSTGIEKTENFIIEVVNFFKDGYYFLTKNQSNDALLYCMTPKVGGFAFNKINIALMPDLGKNPLHISGYKRFGASQTDKWNTIFLGVQYAPNPIAIIDSRNFAPIRLYSSGSFISGSHTLEPSQIWGDPYRDEYIHIVNKGKLHVAANGIISEEVLKNDPLDYRVSNTMFRPSFYFKAFGLQSYTTAFYDDKNKTIRLLTSPSGQYYSFSKSHESAVDDELFKGHDFAYGSYNTNSSEGGHAYTFLTVKDNVLHLFSSAFSGQEDRVEPVKKIGTVNIPNGEKITHYYFDDQQDCYYISIGRAIYRLQLLAIGGNLTLERFIQLPNDNTGDISYFESTVTHAIGDQDNNRFVIVTEDKAKPDGEKSSVYIYDMTDLSLTHTLKNAMGSVVSIYIGI